MRNPMADLVRAGDVVEVFIDGVRNSGGYVTDVSYQGGTLTAGYDNAGIPQRVGIPPGSDRVSVKVLRSGQPPVTFSRAYVAGSSGQVSCVDVREVYTGSEPQAVAAEARAEREAAAREKTLLSIEEKLIRSLGEAGYRSPWHTGDAALAPSGHKVACEDWQRARDEFVATFSDGAKERMLGTVTMENPPLASDVQQAREKAAAARKTPWIAHIARFGITACIVFVLWVIIVLIL